MKKVLSIVVVMAAITLLAGCGASVREIMKIDASMSEITKACEPKAERMSVNCRAGIAQAFLIAPDTTASVRASAEALKGVADTSSAEYKCCYGVGAWISFTLHGIDDLGDKALAKITGLGVF